MEGFSMLSTPAFNAILAVLLISLGMVLYRLFKGPHVLDRVMCLDFVAMLVIAMMIVYAMHVGTQFFFDAVLVLTITGFISTMAIAKYLEDGDIIE